MSHRLTSTTVHESSAPSRIRTRTIRKTAAAPLTPGQRQRNHRLVHYQDLVRPIAWHYAQRSPENAEDLQQVGLLGLLRAAELYDDTTGTPFTAFARPHIRGAILHYLRDQARPVRLPRRHQELEDRLRGVRRELEAQLGRTASELELRQALGLSDEQWQRFLAARRLSRPASLSALENEDADPADPGQEGDDPTLARLLLLELKKLNPVRRQVIRHVVLEGWSLRRTATSLGVSPMTVSRQLKRGLDDLRLALGGAATAAQFA